MPHNAEIGLFTKPSGFDMKTGSAPGFSFFLTL